MSWTSGARARVTANYEAQYADPITFTRGEEIAVTDREEPWRDNPDWLWVWCTDARGKSGWVPKGYVERRGATGVGLRDYSAVELSVTAGELLTVEDEAAGWLLCATEGGRRGWVPLECVDRS
ncbi:MAG: SH3 domain-containing protein [Ktedonobacterales bacterium]